MFKPSCMYDTFHLHQHFGAMYKITHTYVNLIIILVYIQQWLQFKYKLNLHNLILVLENCY